MKWGLTKRNDYAPAVDTFKDEMNRMFDDFFSFRPTTLFNSEWMPDMDVEDTGKEISIRAEVPGLDEKDLNVNVQDNVLTISGEKKEEKNRKDKNDNVIYSERKFGSFSRSFTLPEGADAEKIKASFKKGVLEIEIPKNPSVQPKKIEIAVN